MLGSQQDLTESRGLRQSLDGGVRLAGGSAGERPGLGPPTGNVSVITETLPPAYAQYS